MNLKTYHAYTMNEALFAVKRDLGADAVILHTRTFKRGGFLGIGRKTIVEVTATPASQTRPAQQPVSARKPSPKNVQAMRAYTGQAKTSVATEPSIERVDGDVSQQAIDSSRDRTRRLAMALEEAHRRKQSSSVTPSIAPPQTLPESKSLSKANPPIERTARRFVLTSPDQLPAARLDAPALHVEEKSAQTAQSPMQHELSAIRQMVGQVLQRQISDSNDDATPNAALPAQLFDMYLKLISQDISTELADQIVRAVREELTDAHLNDEHVIRAAVLKQLAAFIPVSGGGFLQASNDGRPLTVALIGPTGVGKTTTLAKLAATYKLHHGKSVGLVTVDTYRIAAVDQLRTYAEIIDVPMHVAITPAELKRAISSMSDRDVILIDTAGRSQRDSGRLAELNRFIAAAQPHEVHLVLSGTASEKVLMQEAEAFSQVGVHKIVLTKLDEAVSFGMLVEVIRKIGKQLSFITTGQEVPEHLEVGSGDRLAGMVLGEEMQAAKAVR